MLEKPDLMGNSSGSDDEEVPDADKVSQEEIDKAFQHKLFLQTEEAVSLKKQFVLYLAKSGNSLIGGLSGGQIQVFDITSTSLTHVHTQEFTDSLCGVRYMKKDPQVFLTGQTSGSICIHDTREKKAVATLDDTTSGTRKPFTVFDVNANDRVICAGTEQILHDVFLLFFDVRQRKLLGGYWESHEDDVTSIAFHPKDPNILASGSTDGLINVFDISKGNEDDALDYSVNTEKTVQQINWHLQKGKDLLTCIMDSNDFHIYGTKDDDQLLSEFSREKITECILRTTPDQCSTIGCHADSSGKMFLVAQSNYQNGESLRMLEYYDKELHPHTNFIGNHQIIRSYVYGEDLFITGGENGKISLWGPHEVKTDEKSHGLKRRKIHEDVKPY